MKIHPDRKAEECSGRVRVSLPIAVIAATALLFPSAQAEPVFHNISAGLIEVIQGAAHDDITLTLRNSVNDFRLRAGSNGGDYNVQVGEEGADDSANGVLMSSVTENGRDHLGTGNKTNCVSMVDFNANGYWININGARGFAAGNNPEYNINVAGAYFPYATWIGAHVKNTANGGALTEFNGSASLTLGTHFIDNGGGRSVVDLTSLGIDSRSDGILLVSGGKNESANFGLSQVNTTNGTWNLFIKDAGAATASAFEQDPIAFVFIPKTNTTVISGRFLGDGTIEMHSGATPQFTVTTLGTGRYELKMIDRSPANGVLIVSSEGGGAINLDNFVTYELNETGDGWEIQSRDTPGAGLESPSATEAVASFVYIPVPTPGITVQPTINLLTTESGGTATFTVSLDSPPASDVTIHLHSSNPAEGTVFPESLTFTPTDWKVPQTVTITGQDDAIADGTVAYTIILSPAVSDDPDYNGIDPADVSVANADNEGGITVAPTSGLTTTEAGGSATFTVRLNTQPSGDVTIPLSSSDTTEGIVSPSSLTFTSFNWDQEQTVTITGVDDLVDDGDVAYTILTGISTSSDPGYNGINPQDVSVINLDDDTAALVFNINVLNTLSVVEGSTTTYTIALATEPVANVTININSSDTTQGGTVTPSLTFTPQNWSTPQTVTILGANDTVVDGTTAFFVTNEAASQDSAYAALPPVTISVTTLDNEAIITPPAEDAVFAIGGPPVGVAGRATIVDPHSPTYNGGTLTVSISANGTSADVLSIRSTGTGAGQISVSGNTISYGGTAIGTFSGGTGTTPLVISFNSASTPTAGEAVLQSVTFDTTSENPSMARRSISIVLVDGDGGTSTASTGVRLGFVREVNFQQGADHGYGIYAGHADIQLRENAPNNAFPTGNAEGLFIDFPRPGVLETSQALMRFDDIIGTAPGQIPPDAVIVSADLILRIPPEDANAQGDGSPLHRMLIPWDAENETWNSIGFGVDLDDVEAKSAFFSAFGTFGAGGHTDTGTISFSVLADILAWQSGEPNHGWVMPGWNPNGTDGTVIRPGEAEEVSERPRLRVRWLPSDVSVATFRQGVDGYADARDTRLRANAPDTDASTLTSVFVDWAVSPGDVQNEDQVLLRFDNITGNAPGQIPPNAQIYAAVLDLASIANNAQGDGGQFFAMLIPWQDTDTWNSLNDGIQADGVEAAAVATAVAGTPDRTPTVQGGYNTFDLTADVQTWVSGVRPNYGWAILPWPNGGDGWGFDTAESAIENNRPRLRVYYSEGGIVTPATLNISISGNQVQISWPASASGTLQSTDTLTSPSWQSVSESPTIVGENKVVTINNPTGTRFYRLSN